MTIVCFRWGQALLVLACSLAAGPAQAHPSPASEMLLSVGGHAISAEVSLPLDELKLAFPTALVDAVDGRRILASDAQLAAYLGAHVRPVAPDGRAWSVSVKAVHWALERIPALVVASVVLRPPAGAPPDRLELHVDAIAHQVPNHIMLVALQDGGPGAKPHMLASLHYGQRSVAIDQSARHWWSGSGDLFKLGMRHIAEGADHLLFLLTLLLPAALRADGGRWGGFAGQRHLLRHLIKVVTAFTLGHSVTLMLGAAGVAAGLEVAPSQPVEMAIALSIMVAAAHAWAPIFPQREGWIAGGFGLVHGLAFASALSDLHLSGARLVTGVLAFNLGIETVQAALVLAAVPVLAWLARTRYYPPVRQASAVVAMALALVWMVQRAGA